MDIIQAKIGVVRKVRSTGAETNADTASLKAIRALLPYGVNPDMIVQSLTDKALGG